MGEIENQISLKAEDGLAGLEDLEVRRIFSGWGFYYRGLLFAAAWEGHFCFRRRRGGRWVYEAVDPTTLQDEEELVDAARNVIAELELEPAARSRRR